ncbi:MAG TPA: CBS domain-containing protein [Acidobacteriota bacterium]|nr:CBS domain-containing protein [Acidobacteriota bacterium]
MIAVKSMLDKKGWGAWTISPEAKVIDALRIMAEKNVGALIVIEKDDIVGIISERDYARKIILKGLQSNDVPVRDIMTAQVYHVHSDTTAEQCMALITEKHIRHLPVRNQGKLAGIISIGDIVKAITTDQKITIENLEDFIEDKNQK